ncbi:hypothetical protein BS50DRAFT_332273 [Corynespora cassiicola Philippines]|uniref:Uncharacterized protein n=1 Tax=Corynespora cassiicola Philippines TaxID=1448308 RepID=A0A2T2NUI0_CORCC|nr:hypothetical protein BS50DRAFT_332273 [Corynespora cassiicola Philippines]
MSSSRAPSNPMPTFHRHLLTDPPKKQLDDNIHTHIRLVRQTHHHYPTSHAQLTRLIARPCPTPLSHTTRSSSYAPCNQKTQTPPPPRNHVCSTAFALSLWQPASSYPPPLPPPPILCPGHTIDPVVPPPPLRLRVLPSPFPSSRSGLDQMNGTRVPT